MLLARAVVFVLGSALVVATVTSAIKTVVVPRAVSSFIVRQISQDFETAESVATGWLERGNVKPGKQGD